MRPLVLIMGAVALVALDCAKGGCSTSGARNVESDLSKIELPSGFRISIYARVPEARSMALSEQGTLFVGTRGDKVYAVRDTNGDGTGDEVLTIAKGLTSPNGVALRGGALYVAEISRILRYDDIEARLSDPPAPVTVNDSFPDDTHHGWKFIRFGPDGKLYVPVGAPCNVCEKGDERYASLMRMNPDGSGLEVFARGIRNTVGFDWQPGTGVLFFTDNGRDQLGDNVPPDELNRAPKPGLHFGFPYCHGGTILDPDHGSGHLCKDYVAPVQNLGPHVASLGMRFYTGDQFPKQYHGDIFIAEHGSWNRSDRIGYRVTRVGVEGDVATSYEAFAEGWLESDGDRWGRPVDVQVMADGSLLVSDDYSGTIYRIRYE